MTQFTINVQDNRVNFFIELIKNFRFVKILKQQKTYETVEIHEFTKEDILNGMKQGLREVELIEQGKMKSTPLKEFLDEF